MLRWAGAALVAGGVLRAAAADPRLDLTGRIVGTNGAPIARATVFIYTASPKQGTSCLCPYCYPDCQKKAQSDADGRFRIESLDPALMFRLLVVAEGRQSELVSKVDPAQGGPTITLKPWSEAALKSGLRIKGAVIDERGKPVPGAVVNPEGVGMGSITRWGGNDALVEPLAVANESGRFVLLCKSNVVDTVYATVEGRGVAEQWATLKPGGDYLLRLPDGVALTGQIVRDGRPLEGVSVGATTKDRTCGVYFNCGAVATGGNGRFLLQNVPPGREFVVYAMMKSVRGNDALPNKIITTGASGTVQDLGALEVQPAFTVAGRVVLSDGNPVPPDTRMFLGREAVQDSQEVGLDADGRFAFKGVPAESVSLSVSINGYRMSRRNPSLDHLNGQILGRVTGDLDNLTVLLEPGKWRPGSSDESDGAEAYPVNLPLRSPKL